MWTKIICAGLIAWGVLMITALIVEWNTGPIVERQEETPAMIEWPRIVTVQHVGHGSGSGFVVAPELVLTAAHAVGVGPLLAGDRPATIVKVSDILDVALLRVPGLNGSAAQFTGSRMGQEVWIVGDVPWKCGRERIVHRGYVAARHFGDRMLIGGTSHPGLSGCPVMNERGEVIGMLIAVRKIWGHPSFGNILVIPTSTLVEFIEEDLNAVRQADPSREGSTPCRPDRVGVAIPGPGCATVPQMAE